MNPNREAIRRIIETSLVRFSISDHPTPGELTDTILTIRDRSVLVSATLATLRPQRVQQQLNKMFLDVSRKAAMRNALETNPRVRSATSAEERKQRAEGIANEEYQDRIRDTEVELQDLEEAIETLEHVYRDLDNARRDITTISYLWQAAVKLETSS